MPVLPGLAIGCLLALTAGGARAFDGPDSAPAPTAKAALAAPDSERLAVDIGLPLAFRIRLDGAHARNRTLNEGLVSLRFARLGPAIRSPLAVETQVALMRAIGGKGFEVGVAWAARSRLSGLESLGFDRQFVGALIRFSH
jgi:hypothetical protein